MALKDLALATDGDYLSTTQAILKLSMQSSRGFKSACGGLRANGCSIPLWARLTLKQSL